MPHPQPPKDNPPNNPKDPASLVLRIDRAADHLNPVLMVFAVGLLVLNITLYLGMAMAREPFGAQPRQSGSLYAQPVSSTPAFNGASVVGTAGN